VREPYRRRKPNQREREPDPAPRFGRSIARKPGQRRREDLAHGEENRETSSAVRKKIESGAAARCGRNQEREPAGYGKTQDPSGDALRDGLLDKN
jgi:hypothetical protein